MKKEEMELLITAYDGYVEVEEKVGTIFGETPCHDEDSPLGKIALIGDVIRANVTTSMKEISDGEEKYIQVLSNRSLTPEERATMLLGNE